MNFTGFTNNGNWYKGNLHSHTTNSDGRLTPEQSVLLHRQHGYSFVCFSEHDFYTDNRKQFDGEDFIVLPGLEASACLIDTTVMERIPEGISLEQGYVDMTWEEMREFLKQGFVPNMIKTHHIHGILGTEAMQKAAGDKVFRENEHIPFRVYFDHWDGREVAQKLSDSLKERGCFTTYNHPIWSRVDVEEVRDLTGIWAIECYNYATVNECAEGLDTVFWDAMLRRGNEIMGFASDDNHNGGIYPESFGGYVMVKSEKLDHESIVSNLLAGNYYFSNGASINQWGVRENKVYVQCDGAERVNFICGGGVGASKTIMTDNGIPLKEVEFPLTGRETYVRVEVVDMQGKMAWTNAVNTVCQRSITIA